jgi:hypothetical protein
MITTTHQGEILCEKVYIFVVKAYISIKQQQARLAQSVARETLNLKVEGSSPSSGC